MIAPEGKIILIPASILLLVLGVLSYYIGNIWANSVLIYPGPSAYSCLTRLPNGNIGIFYERGVKQPYEELVFLSISPEMIISKTIQILSLISDT